MFKLITGLLFIISFCCAAQSPAIFMEGDVSTNLNERDLAISPDGTEMLYTIQASQHALSTIIHRKKTSGGKWSAPEVASFSGMYSDLEPAFSPDGRKIFFSSNRPLSAGKVKDYDIWMVEKNNTGWSVPKNIGSPVNTSANEFYPSVTNNGSIYFTGEYSKGIGKEDIFISKYSSGTYTEPVALDTAVNSKLWEFNAFVSPDESFILFTSYGRDSDKGGGDLYISQRRENKWQPAQPLTLINSAQLDYCPFVTNGKLYFTSGRHSIKGENEKAITYSELIKLYNGPANGSENIYWIDFGGSNKKR